MGRLRALEVQRSCLLDERILMEASGVPPDDPEYVAVLREQIRVVRATREYAHVLYSMQPVPGEVLTSSGMNTTCSDLTSFDASEVDEVA